MNLILNNKSEELINPWISLLLRINTIELADLEYLNSHVSEVVALINKENLDALNSLFADNNLQQVGLQPTAAIPEIVDVNDLPF